MSDYALQKRRTLWLGGPILAVALAVPFFACGDEPPARETSNLPPRVQAIPASEEPRPVITIEVADHGEIHIELLPDIAPRTVDNFLKLMEEEFYSGTTFHRVIPEFAIQAGDPFTKDRDPRNDGTGGPGYFIEDEFGPYSHVRGVVSMANRGRPKSAGSQFFIVVEDAPPLDGRYAVFGRVVGGMDVVDSVSQVPRDEFGRWGPPDRPRENVVISEVRMRDTGAAARPDLAGGEASKPVEAALAGEASSR